MFDSAELASMRAEQVAHMQDMGKVLTQSAPTNDSFGEPVDSFAEGAEIACGLEMRPGSERWGREMTLVEYDAVLRLAIGTVIAAKDRFKVTRRFGVSLTVPVIYEVVSPAQIGPSGLRVLLKKVEL